MMRAGQFPEPLKISTRAVRWSASEIEACLLTARGRAAKRKPPENARQGFQRLAPRTRRHSSPRFDLGAWSRPARTNTGRAARRMTAATRISPYAATATRSWRTAIHTAAPSRRSGWRSGWSVTRRERATASASPMIVSCIGTVDCLVTGFVPNPVARDESAIANRIRFAINIWCASKPAMGTPVEAYSVGRRLAGDGCSCDAWY